MVRAFPIGRFAGIRLDVHPTWFVLFAFITWTLATVPSIAAFGRLHALALGSLAALALFCCVVIHEFAHALVARACGIRTRSIALFLFGGVATLEAEPEKPAADALIALAGPAVSALLAALSYGALRGVDRVVAPAQADAVAAILAYMIWVNAVLAIFNLIPAYPMDGGRVLRALLWRLRGDRDGATASAALVGIALALLLAGAGITAAFATRTWQFGWYVLLAAYVVWQCTQQYRALRPRRLPRATAAAVAASPAGAITA